MNEVADYVDCRVTLVSVAMSEPADNEFDGFALPWPVNSSASNFSGLAGNKLHFNCSSASWLLQTCTSRFSIVKTVFVPVVCVVGIIGNLLTLFVLSRRRLSVVSDGSVRAVHSCMKALAVSDLIKVRYSLTVLKVPLNPNQSINQSIVSFIRMFMTIDKIIT